MPILADRKTSRSSIDCVREVRVGVPFDRRRESAEFYVKLLGLRPWPDERQAPGGWGVGDAERGVYLQFRHDPPVDPLRRRVTVTVDCLDALAARLQARDWPFERVRGLSAGDDCLFTNDPSGHRLAIRQRRAL